MCTRLCSPPSPTRVGESRGEGTYPSPTRGGDGWGEAASQSLRGHRACGQTVAFFADYPE